MHPDGQENDPAWPLHDRLHDRLHASSTRAYAVLITVAALSGTALHMVRSTTAADTRDLLAQPNTLPIALHGDAIDSSLAPLQP